MSDNGNNGNNGNNDDNNQQSSSNSRQSSSTIKIPQTAAVGGVTITQPKVTATSYYKIAENQMITFGWNMTSVIATPTSITVSAICENGNTYPVGIVDGDATELVWDIYSYQQHNPNSPLVPASYTLSLWDDRGPDAGQKAGYMKPNGELVFAMYTPADYTSISDGWRCGACNSSLTNAATNPAFLGIVVTFVVMLLSGIQLLRDQRH
ncbi:uncharacterized protein SCHCODRAFT_02680536 [Schizophyllum commune H4-8]|uniref:DUF7137 domain-containing protein n=1 Tax=Schizophyllum commune (strain H4-8 / FGSC 9210) TaxID=578458 RepID=D8QDD5_SCHCM|nr:uncharacterized protein SCHCODRAFT_02680536 [Schizophyllum commune H4-8]KAI5888763.1 hypothetical protein SCHCODRAFT_02680536 [Schizophyllum commune H4-8]